MGVSKIDGWLWACLGCILLVIFGTLIVSSATGVAAGNAVFIWLTVRGFIKWRKNFKK